METSFTLKTEKLVPFVGRLTDRQLQGLFLFKDERLVEAVKLIMGEAIAHIGHKYKTNMEIYSLIAAWGLELEDSVDKVKKILRALISEKYVLGMDSIFEWAIPGVGIDVCKGVEAPVNYIPFVRWQEDEMKVRFKALAKRGWEALKTFVE